jgi:hypothetical protein
MMTDTETPQPSSSTPLEARGVVVSGDGRSIAWITEQRMICFATEGCEGEPISHPTGPALPENALHVLEGAPQVAMAVSGDGRRVVTIDNGAIGYVSLRAWDIATGQCTAELQGGRPATAIATSRRGQFAAVATWGREVHLVSLDGPRVVVTVAWERPIVSLVYVTEGSRYAVGRDAHGFAVLIDFIGQLASAFAERVHGIFAIGCREVALVLTTGKVAVLHARRETVTYVADLGRSVAPSSAAVDGRSLISLDSDGELACLSFDDGGVTRTTVWKDGRHRVRAVHPAARAVITQDEGKVTVRSLSDGRVVASFEDGMVCSASNGGTIAVGMRGASPHAVRLASAGVCP